VMPDLERFLGLPWRRGADPRDGIACDCLLLAFAIQDELDLPHPEPEPEWFAMAERGEWAALRRVFLARTVPAEREVDGAMLLMGGGVAVSAHSYAWGADECLGVYRLPLRMVPPRGWRRFP